MPATCGTLKLPIAANAALRALPSLFTAIVLTVAAIAVFPGAEYDGTPARTAVRTGITSRIAEQAAADDLPVYELILSQGMSMPPLDVEFPSRRAVILVATPDSRGYVAASELAERLNEFAVMGITANVVDLRTPD